MPERNLSFRLNGLLTAALLGWISLPSISHGEFFLKDNDMLAICGDSITNMKEYPAYIEDYLLMCQPVPGIQVEQFGISGEKASGLLARMDHAVLPFKPTVVSVCYGMNDGAYQAPDPAVAEAYRKNETELITRFKAAGVRTGVLASPGAVDRVYHKKTEINYNDTLAGLRDVAREVAAKEGFAFADLHSLMEKTMAAAKKDLGNAYVFAGGDGVHPVPAGHLTMAYGILKAMGCDGAIGTFTVDLNSQKTEASSGHKILSEQNGKIEIESSRYPFCFTVPGTKASADKGLEPILPYLPFNQDLNRFVLIVKGLKTPSAKITWGGQTKVFSKEELEKGINLAAEFLDNPFSESFFKVHTAVRKQQQAGGEEMRAIMNPLGKEPDKAKAAQLQQETVATAQKRAEAVRALVVPVKHTIQIEAQP